MECCRICLTTNELSDIFETDEIAPNITAIACVDINQNDGLPQFICMLCKHELDISINFKNKCENTFEMLKEQHNKELEVKESIILNLLSGRNVLDNHLPKLARESVLNSIKNDVKSRKIGTKDKEYLLEMGKDNLIYIQGGLIYENSNDEQKTISKKDQTQMEIIDQEQINSITEFDDQITGADDQTITDAEGQLVTVTDDHIMTSARYSEDQISTVTDPDDEMTDTIVNEFEDSLSIGNENLKCVKCNVCFENERHLFDHLTEVHPKTMGQCQICLTYFSTSQLLKDHLSAKHDVTDDNANLDTRCKICNKVFGRQSVLNTHLCLSLDQTDFGCQLCQLNFNFEEDLENHIKYIHQQVEFTCEQCNENFDLFDHYSEHLKEHSNRYRNINQIELWCSECDKCFLSNETWNEHNSLCHAKEYPNGKSSKNLNMIFEKTTSGPFVCPLCEKSFKINSMLESHVKIHTGEKPYKCPHCHKIFGKPAHLSAHQRIHRGTKPHVCSICQMSFYRKDTLESHLLRHDNLIKCTRKETYIRCDVGGEVEH